MEVIFGVFFSLYDVNEMESTPCRLFYQLFSNMHYYEKMEY
jgi:hypothetical protein